MTERHIRIPSGDLELEGILHLPDGDPPCPGVVVCHPHPQYGGDMHNNVVMVLCEALTERGIAALRFNFRGVGRSTGAYDGGRGEALDAAAALTCLAGSEEFEATAVGVAGYSFGAMTALAAADDRTRALALVSPPLQWLDRERFNGFRGPLLLVAGDADHVTPEQPFRELAASVDAAEAHIVVGADHSWWGYERELAGIAGAFFAGHLGTKGAG